MGNLKKLVFVVAVTILGFGCEAEDGGSNRGGPGGSGSDISTEGDVASDGSAVDVEHAADVPQGSDAVTEETTTEACNSGVPCASVNDCPEGHACTSVTSPPSCQRYGCAGDGDPCDDTALCTSPLVCLEGLCRGSDACLSGTTCAADSDCPDGHRCNHALQTPTCQQLYCGAAGSPCDEDVLCEQGMECMNGACSTDTDLCTAGVCNVGCAEIGLLDPDCHKDVAECNDPMYQEILQEWFDGAYTDRMSPNTRNCDWTPLVCDTQFRCSTIHCFCDPDCYVKDGNGQWGLPPACANDGFCDSWCPIGGDPDCVGSPEDGKYCG